MTGESRAVLDDMRAALLPVARVVDIDSAECARCGFRLGQHSHDGWHCPNPSDWGPLYATTTFTIRGQA